MKERTSITLSREILKEVARHAGSGESRSAYIERVLRRHFRRKERAAAQARDIERINAVADRLNAEAEDVLGYTDYVGSLPPAKVPALNRALRSALDLG